MSLTIIHHPQCRENHDPNVVPCDQALYTTEPIGRKFDHGKPRYDLLPPKALAMVVRVLTYGANKYEPNNWKHVRGARWRYFRAVMTHLWQWWMGELIDGESGLPHLAHAACNILFLLGFQMEDAEITEDYDAE